MPSKYYYQLNKEKYLQERKERYKNNKDKEKEQRRIRYKEDTKKSKIQTYKYRDEHKEWYFAYAKKYREDNRERINAESRNRRKLYKENFFEMYGNTCACCGEGRLGFLTIEHKQGQKGIPRLKKKVSYKAYKDALENYRPDLYETLCMNCNFATRFGDVCPHKI